MVKLLPNYSLKSKSTWNAWSELYLCRIVLGSFFDMLKLGSALPSNYYCLLLKRRGCDNNNSNRNKYIFCVQAINGEKCWKTLPSLVCHALSSSTYLNNISFCTLNVNTTFWPYAFSKLFFWFRHFESLKTFINRKPSM